MHCLSRVRALKSYTGGRKMMIFTKIEILQPRYGDKN